MGLVRTETDGFITTVTLDNPAKRNALDVALLTELVAALEDARTRECRALILRAADGVRTWSAGHDIDDLPRDNSDPLQWTNPAEAVLRAVREVPFPVIAAVEGGVWGAACNLVVTCDLVVATTSATFAITPAKLGVPYNTAGVNHFLAALPLAVAKEMFFTAEPITAEQAATWGLVNRVVEDGAAMTATATSVAQRIASLAPLSIAAIKAEMTALTDARTLTSDTFERLTALRRAAWRSDDYREGLAAFAERRPATFTGS